MMLVQSLAPIFSGQWIWRKYIFKFRQYGFPIIIISSFEEGRDTSFRGSGNSLHEVPIVKIGSVVIENE